MKISVIGLGKLGACTAACFASKGYKVIGIDINQKIVSLINNSKSPYLEKDLENLLSSNNNLRATTDYSVAVNETDLSFLILPTPSLKNGDFSSEYLKKSLISLSGFLKDKDKFHTFVIVSTVSPGTIENILIPVIESESGKKLNEDFGVVYNPEFIALGSVIKDFLNPDMVLIGESCKKSGDLVESVYKYTCENNPYIARMNIISAEITKISLNSFVTMKISFANTLGNICDKIPKANVNDITKALGADKRVSPFYIKAGPPYGGPCFPRDNRAFRAFSARHGIDAKLAKATDEINDYQIDEIVKKILNNLPQDRRISVIGLAYKDNTPVIEESAAIKVIEKLINNDIEIIYYDRLVENLPKNFISGNNKIVRAINLKECIEYSSLIVNFSVDIKSEKYLSDNNKLILNLWN